MQTIEVCMQISDLTIRSPINSAINRLFSRKSSNHEVQQPQKSNLRHRKKSALQQKRNYKRQQISFLAKTYLEFGMRSDSFKTHRKLSKKKIERNDKLTPVPYIKQSIDVDRQEKIDNYQIEQIEYDNKKLIPPHCRKRQAQSAVSRSVVYPKRTIEVPTNDLAKQIWSRKTSSTSKKIEQAPVNIAQPNLVQMQKCVYVKPIKSVPFIKQTKYYSCAPASKCLSTLLERNGFSQLKGDGAVLLKWTQHEHFQQYNNVQFQEVRYYNHIKNNPLLSKAGFCKVYKLLCEQNCKPHRFLPRIYNHKDSQEYVKDYQLNCILILLDKHIQYCKLKQPIFNNMEKLSQIKKKRNVVEQSLDLFLERKEYLSKERKDDYLINVSMCVLLLKTLEYQRYIRLDTDKTTEIKVDDRSYKNLIRFSKIYPNYDQYARNQFSTAQDTRPAPSPSRQSKWQTPSHQLILKLLFYKSYFQELAIYPSGWDNLWTVRSVHDKQEVATKEMITLDKDVIVWKRIENLWFADDNIDQKSKQENILYSKRFEMIQPVLIKSVDPLAVYSFSECYYRIYNGQQQEQEERDKNKYQQQLYLYESVFEKHMLKLQPKFSLKHLKNIVSFYIKGIIKIASIYMANLPGCFQLINFHVSFDQNMNPWITNISKSSNMERKAYTMKEYYSALLLNTLKIVMTKDHFKLEISKEKYFWTQLIKDKHNDLVQQMWLETYGKKMAIQKKIVIDETKGSERDIVTELKYITLIQKSIRKFIKNKK